SSRAPFRTTATTRPTVVASNILRGDYAGSKACAECHADIYEKWSASPMHRMTRSIQATEIRAPFSGEIFSFKEDRATMTRLGSERHMQLDSSLGSHTFRITRV